MNTFARVALAVMSLATSPALAESEGGGNPYAFAAAPQVTAGRAFVTDTWSDAQPQATGYADQASSMEDLLPSSGNETPVQTAASLPVRSMDGTVTYARMRTPAPAQDALVLAFRNPARHATPGATR